MFLKSNWSFSGNSSEEFNNVAMIHHYIMFDIHSFSLSNQQ